MKQFIFILLSFFIVCVNADAQTWLWGDYSNYYKASGKNYDINTSGDTVRIFDPATAQLTLRSKVPTAQLIINQEGSGTNAIVQTSYANGSSSPFPSLNQRQSRGTFASPNSATVVGDVFGAWQAFGNTGSAFGSGSFLFYQAAETWKDTGKHRGTNVRWQLYGVSTNNTGGTDTASRDRFQYSAFDNTIALIPIGATYNFSGGVGVGRATNSILGRFDVGIGLPTQTGITVRGTASQTANLFQLMNSLNAVIASFDANGNLSAPNVLINGSSTQSGDGVATTFNIAHGLGTTPTWWFVTAASADAGNISYVTADATNLIIHYTVAPASGTNNLTFKYSCK